MFGIFSFHDPTTLRPFQFRISLSSPVSHADTYTNYVPLASQSASPRPPAPSRPTPPPVPRARRAVVDGQRCTPYDACCMFCGRIVRMRPPTKPRIFVRILKFRPTSSGRISSHIDQSRVVPSESWRCELSNGATLPQIRSIFGEIRPDEAGRIRRMRTNFVRVLRL